jgi:Uma2 family endonuclease
MLLDREYWQYCKASPDLWIERSAAGEPQLRPPAGCEASYRQVEILAALDSWASKDGRGNVSGPTAQFFLLDGSALSASVAWVTWEALRATTRYERKTIPRICPQFVVEVLAFNDRLSRLKRKMKQWIANGVQLAWLIDGDAQTVYVYQPRQPVETRKGILKLAGKGPVKGFVLQLRTIWEGLK